MKFWIARDKDGHLYLFDEKPILSGGYFNASTNGHTTHLFNNALWNEITFESSPQEVEFKLVKETNALDLFKKLPHLNDNKEVVDDWESTPNLYHFDTMWHVSWMHCDDGYELIGFDGETPEEAIQKAFDWCVELKLIK